MDISWSSMVWGFIIVSIPIFFLNYYRMDVINEDAISGAGRSEAFPSFLSKQYE